MQHQVENQPGNLSILSATVREFAAAETASLRHRLLGWVAQFPYAAFLDSCESPIDRHGRYEWLIGVARQPSICLTDPSSLETAPDTWLMGGLSYELKNAYEPRLSSRHRPAVAFPPVSLFAPELVIYRLRGENRLHLWGREDWLPPLDELPALPAGNGFVGPAPALEPLASRAAYLRTVEQLRTHIGEGDCYEVNLTQEFRAAAAPQRPEQLFAALTEVSPVPFAAFFRWQDRYLLSASPERFLQLRDGHLLSQPIKGTAPRSEDPVEDARLREALLASEKERAENVMIVDLTRNDLHRCCETGSVSVPHLFEIQRFPQVHQMVSTVQGRLQADLRWPEILRRTFPPGSMTGAPKVKVMELIDRYEWSGRGLYAGSVGYVTPLGEFDWNVVIRSLAIDRARPVMSYHVGGAITYDSEAGAEYDETLVKARAIRRVLQ